MTILRGRARYYVQDNVELIELVEFPDEMFTPSWFDVDLKMLKERRKRNAMI